MANYLGAVGIAVRDMEASATFYAHAFGMRELQRFNLPHMDEIVMGFEGRSAAVVLMQYTDDIARPPHAFAGKLVFYFEDVVSVAKRAVEAGAVMVREPAPVPGLGPTLIGFVKDPDGYTLELLQPA
ncbi:MAG: VOC family protein [Alphaproteobacteria bacterium]|nr:VOC family protein [Alphaproteobacteria bacterium]